MEGREAPQAVDRSTSSRVVAERAEHPRPLTGAPLVGWWRRRTCSDVEMVVLGRFGLGTAWRAANERRKVEHGWILNQ